METERRVVYLEDIEAPKTKTKDAKSTPNDASSNASPGAKGKGGTQAKTGVTAVKRQRTLVDMFSSAPAEPSAKKPKLGKTGSSNSLTSSSTVSRTGSAANFGLQALNSIPFSLSAYQESLTEDQRRLLKLELESMGKSWLKLLKDEIKKSYFISLKEFLWGEGVQGADDSAKNIKVYPAPWAENGVLMLNTCLTVRAGDAGSHSSKGWEQFTDKVVDVVDRYGGANLPTLDSSAKTGHGRGVVFLAWGAWAAKRVAKLDKTKHLILMSAHPSPFSAHKGFLGNGHFKKANDWLEGRYGPDGRVDWCRLDPVI
ncbi:hypothetical protein EWM64_g1138 [Hericium alpestre]|uniref:Uracil-DNA glycosylase-like domain-containing protein n=1 Tax=Hericium alpestre TaxID=135208 RepID=A0A4Z0A9C6_9AGAM|nr:hypothetical protein EWM64_g1138 [Hericium alpestre]